MSESKELIDAILESVVSLRRIIKEKDDEIRELKATIAKAGMSVRDVSDARKIEIFGMHQKDGLSFAEIGRKLGFSATQANFHAKHGCKLLQRSTVYEDRPLRPYAEAMKGRHGWPV